ncbi:conserved hypothetical protein [Ancylobacter novellus DSM 506]|uniref:Lysozyme inhibitor LprI-like N-terminal domain-containing protein n=1 Tax=Ancylobacter novellus (strain ATCC 8093 / DSM 506 / JCM 20403 / CCM 1077 / IAM 12100 / NBRC 12443 / NCIMB 10456) TaxID=639283 RepID=D7A6P5_ANCN5|nr:lysozyme inhibitor LprI family protein [Ancylobacter novellus]ADH90243.1 conserved hypothetical protein [Ancylobacter novellus DSM 506]
MARLAVTVILAALALVGSESAARAHVPTGCTHDGTDPRTYLDCLNARQKDSERKLARSVAGAQAAIDAREDLQPAQRRRWRALFEEAQSRFVQWRNFECQSIAPFEGDGAAHGVGGRLGGIGMLEQRMVCLITQNDLRVHDLEDRYAPAGGWPELPPEEAKETELAPAAPAAEVPPASAMPAGTPRIIEITP